MIRKRYDELKPGDVFRLTDRKTYILVAEVRERANGTMVEINGFRRADPPENGQYNFGTRYLVDREVEVYSLEEIDAPSGPPPRVGCGARPRELHVRHSRLGSGGDPNQITGCRTSRGHSRKLGVAKDTAAPA